MAVGSIEGEVVRRLEVAEVEHPRTWAVARRVVGRMRQDGRGEVTITEAELRQLLRSAESEASLLALLGRRYCMGERRGKRPRRRGHPSGG